MSLHQIAQDVQSRGRGEDSVLIHMTPKEVQGLQALAMAGGGSLTVNPDTGLPEAGFLSSLLPTLIGAGLSIASGGTLTPLMAAGLVGGGTALATGNIQKGLMAGLGAYGGAGLGAGLAGAGAGAAQQAATAGGAAAAETAAYQTAQQQAMQGLTGSAANEAAAKASMGLMQQGYTPQGFLNLQAAQATQPFAGSAIGPATTTQMPVMDRIGAGFKALGTESGRDLALQSMGGGKKALQYGLAALAPSAMGMQPEYRKPEEEAPYLYQFNREQQAPTRQGPYTSEQQYFTAPTLTRIPGYAEGGMTGASQEAFDYLMGRSDVSPARAAAQERMAGLPAQAPAAAVAGNTARPKINPLATDFPRLILGAIRDPGSLSGRGEARSLLSPSRSDSPMFNYDPRTGGLAQIAPTVTAPPESYRYEDPYASAGYAKGGMAKGGFVVPADVVSMLGEGSTDAGIRALQSKYGPAVQPIKGPGTGQSDSIPTTIEGKQPARVADGEAYVPPVVVQRNGGAKKFYSMLDNVRTASQGHTKQQRRVNPERVMA